MLNPDASNPIEAATQAGSSDSWPSCWWTSKSSPQIFKLRSVQQMGWTYHVKRHKEKLEITGGLITLKKKIKVNRRVNYAKRIQQYPNIITFLLLNIFIVR